MVSSRGEPGTSRCQLSGKASSRSPATIWRSGERGLIEPFPARKIARAPVRAVVRAAGGAGEAGHDLIGGLGRAGQTPRRLGRARQTRRVGGVGRREETEPE